MAVYKAFEKNIRGKEIPYFMIEHYTDLHKEEVFAMLKDNSKGKGTIFKQQKRLFELFPQTGIIIKDEFNTIVGCAHFKKEKNPSKNVEINNFAFNDKVYLHYYLNLIYIVPEFRRRKFAREFLFYLEYMAGTKSIPKIVFGSELQNESAKNLFSKAGYEQKEIKALNGGSYIFWKKDIPKREIGAGFRNEFRKNY